jgi:hypothetical protein
MTAGTPLPRKLGITASTRVLVLAAPDGFQLPDVAGDVALHTRPSGRDDYDVILLFCRDVAALLRRFAPARDRLRTAGALWACWPKKASGVRTDLSETTVREHGIGCGLVDVKVAAIDATWSGLKFVRRRADRS